ncbi:MAG: hypothetical protein JKX73_09015 [Flavobacteriales bacterium]|nr:hypothetical protein [Flavobacteriales bacterium]
MLRFIILLILIPNLSFSQNEKSQYIDKGLLRAQGNITMGTMLDYDVSNYYIAGDLEYYTSSLISIRGSWSHFLGGGQWTNFDVNHSGVIGALLHFPTKGKFDPYFGVEPGFAISKYNGVTGFIDPSAGVTHILTTSSYPVTVNPLFTTALGFNFYGDRYFSIFANVRFVQGKHYSDIAAVSLNEIKFSFGLGWHFWARKGYCKFEKPEVK